MPFMGKEHPELDAVRKLTVLPHNIIFYTILRNEIIILKVLDSRKK
jgi:plasmid stabilization system protein ParE